VKPETPSGREPRPEGESTGEELSPGQPGRPEMRYYVTVAGRTVAVDLNGEAATIDGEGVEVQLVDIEGTDLKHLSIGPSSYALIARPGDRRGVWAITVGGRTLTAEAVDERTRTIREMSGGAPADAERVVIAPMPGLVVRVNVGPGDMVSAGQGLVVVEAMKMENELKAPTDGIVTRVAVEPGAAVEKGAVLVVLE
jgi:biotin carboxyl carrier protein